MGAGNGGSMASPSSTIQHLAYERSAGLLHSASAPSPFLPPRIAVHEKAFEIGSNCYSRQETKSPSCYPRSQGRRDAFDDTTQTRSLGKGNSKPRIPAGAIHWLGFPFFPIGAKRKMKRACCEKTRTVCTPCRLELRRKGANDSNSWPSSALLPPGPLSAPFSPPELGKLCDSPLLGSPPP